MNTAGVYARSTWSEEYLAASSQSCSHQNSPPTCMFASKHSFASTHSSFSETKNTKNTKNKPNIKTKNKGDHQIHTASSPVTRGAKSSSIVRRATEQEISQHLKMDYEKHSICLIFAANKYPNADTLPNLSCAVNDGMLVAETLCGLKPIFVDGTDGDNVWESPAAQDSTLGQGFKVKMFIEQAVTREAIDKELMTLISHYKTPQIGRLYICMAGHGLPDDTTGSSFFCCSNYNKANEYGTSYPLKELKTKLERIGLKHQVVHLDCCHAGGIFLESRARPVDYRAASMATKPVVTAITAVTHDETALETQGHGIFSKHLCEQVKEQYIFDRWDRDYVTMSELFSATQELVTNQARESHHDMTPMHKDILSKHWKEQCSGEMIFFRPASTATGAKCWGVVEELHAKELHAAVSRGREYIPRVPQPMVPQPMVPQPMVPQPMVQPLVPQPMVQPLPLFQQPPKPVVGVLWNALNTRGRELSAKKQKWLTSRGTVV